MGAALTTIRPTALRQLSEGLADLGGLVGDLVADAEPPTPRRPPPPNMYDAQAVDPKRLAMSPRPRRTISIDDVHAGFIFFDPVYRL